MSKISDDIIWRYVEGIGRGEDMKGVNEYMSGWREKKKYVFWIEELYDVGKWK